MEPRPDGKKPFIVEHYYTDPQTVPEMAANDIVDIHNAAERGEISAVEASEKMAEVEKMRISVGDGWFDKYGPPPPELEDFYEDRYWEKDPKDRT